MKISVRYNRNAICRKRQIAQECLRILAHNFCYAKDGLILSTGESKTKKGVLMHSKYNKMKIFVRVIETLFATSGK
jgi:hypothetical protein